MQDYRKLKVWNDAMAFCVYVYATTKSYPDDEKYGLTSQLRRAAVSISTNIAEGSGRRTPADFKRFLCIAMGSLKECETLLALSVMLGCLPSESSRTIIANTELLGKKMNALIKAVGG